jgi:hypothetical protein
MLQQVELALHQSAMRIVTGVVSVLPGLVALSVAVLVSVLLGLFVGSIIRRTLVGLEFDRRVAAWGLDDLTGGWWTPARYPSALVARVATWSIVILGFLVGLAAFDPTLTSTVMGRLFGSLINLVTAAVVMIAGVLAARFVSRGVLISLVNLQVEQARLVSLGVRWLLLVFSGAIALNQLRIGGAIVDLAFGILFGGIVLTLALAIGLRSKEIGSWQPPEAPRDERQKSIRHF